MVISRIERFIALIGGEANLPSKLPQEVNETAVEVKTSVSDNNNIPTAFTSATTPLQRSNINHPSDELSCQILLTTQPDSSSFETPAMPSAIDIDSRWGEPAPVGLKFAPFIAVTKFCYKFVSKDLTQPLASAFFDQDKIYNRGWDMYFINSDYTKFISFVPVHQLQALFVQINEAFPEANLGITDEFRNQGLIIDFDGFGKELRPHWMGRMISREHLSHMVHQTTLMPELVVSTAPETDERLQAWKHILDLASEANRTKKKAKTCHFHQHQKTGSKLQSEADQVLRTRKYLGLFPDSDEEASMPNITRLTLQPYDFSQATVHTFKSDVIFIAIDIEASERPPHHVTEIGVATLDTRDLYDVAPGRVGTNWHRLVRPRHFRVREYQHHINHKFVRGCPDMFEFGTSEFVSEADIVSTLDSCFREPFGKAEHNTLHPDHQHAEMKATTRNLVLVGHDVTSDIDYCKKMGFDILDRGNILDTLDTASLDRAYTGKPQTTSLGNILYSHDLTGWNLHNAGNDAVYTIHAMLATCVHAASQGGRASEESGSGRDIAQPDDAWEEW